MTVEFRVLGPLEPISGGRPLAVGGTRTVKELVLGSGIKFADRGSRRIGETPGTRRLFAVTGGQVLDTWLTRRTRPP